MSEMGSVDPSELLRDGPGNSPRVARLIQRATEEADGPRIRYGVVVARSMSGSASIPSSITVSVAGTNVPSIRCLSYLPLVGETVALIQTEGSYVCAGSVPADTGWINLQLLNGWVNFDSGTTIGGSGRPCQIRRMNGMVFYKGVARSGTAGTVAFQAPSGFRPEVLTTPESAWIVSGGATQVTIDAATGNVALSNATFTYLSGIVPYPAA